MVGATISGPRRNEAGCIEVEIAVTLALGANLGEPIEQLRTAVIDLRSVLTITAISDVYVTEPVGIRDQPDFYNLVLQGMTTRTVYSLHAEAQRIESSMGRIRGERDGPRTIDIDLLGYGDLVMTSSSLTLPHPRLHERAFVLGPLSQIDPEWRHPQSGRSAQDMFDRLGNASGISRRGPLGAI